MSDEPDVFDPIPVDGLLLALCEMARTLDGFELGIPSTSRERR